MRFNVIFTALLICISSLSVARSTVKTVPLVDAQKFAGTWYRISANPIIVEPACACARQVLTPKADGTIAVYNSCNKGDRSGKLVEIRGTAIAKDASVSKLAVDFGLPWKGSYWIVAVDVYYRYAVVTDSLGYSLYVMSRAPVLSDELYDEALAAAKANNVNISRLKVQSQQGCNYPPEN